MLSNLTHTMPVKRPLIFRNISLDLNSLPLEASTAESTTTNTFVKPVCRCTHFLTVNKYTVVLAAELVCHCRIFLVD